MITTVALVVVGVQLNDTFIGKVVPKLCAVGNVGSESVNPFTCAFVLAQKTIAVIINADRKYILICFMIIILGF